jgi:alpha-glucosidase
VWAFQDDPKVRTIAGEKMIGPDLLVATVAADRAKTLDVYLPAGATWVELDGTTRHTGGTQLKAIPLRDRAGVLKLPMFARAGAIVPVALVDARTMNVLGKRTDGTRDDALRARIFPTLEAASTTSFTLFEDDGTTTAYTTGELRMTDIIQTSEPANQRVTVSIAPARGTYRNAPPRRAAVLDIVLDANQAPLNVIVDGAAVPRRATAAALDKAASGWYVTAPGRVRVKAAEEDVGTQRVITVGW